jgi:hypothetical protein
MDDKIWRSTLKRVEGANKKRRKNKWIKGGSSYRTPTEENA